MNWARILAFVTGMMDKELFTRSEYLVAENRILKAQLNGRLKLSDAERTALAEIGHRLGRKVLADMICSWPWEARRIMDWDEYFRQQAAMYRKLAEKTEDAFIKQNSSIWRPSNSILAGSLRHSHGQRSPSEAYRWVSSLHNSGTPTRE